ncbi:MAG: polysaccharide biosynthesis protein [Acidobacteriaceae bacterium]
MTNRDNISSLPLDHPADWSALLQNPTASAGAAALAAPFAAGRILITGAAGSIGSALAKCVATFQPEHLILLDSSEHGLYELQNHLSSLPAAAPFTVIPGSICDAPLLAEVLATHRPHIVYHAAAYKHAPLMEHHPLAALSTNTIGTHKLAQACLAANTPQLILLSTDKAVNPVSIMGASKRLAELAVFAINNSNVRTKALRLGNVLGSRGSVVPLFQAQIEKGGPITITHPDIRRYFLPLRESIQLLAALAQPAWTSGIYIPHMGAPIRILDLAHFLMQKHAPNTNIPIVFTGLRPGDKMDEQLIAPEESLDASTGPAPLSKVSSPQPPPDLALRIFSELEQAVQQRNVERALQLVQEILPGYQPSDHLRKKITRPVTSL